MITAAVVLVYAMAFGILLSSCILAYRIATWRPNKQQPPRPPNTQEQQDAFGLNEQLKVIRQARFGPTLRMEKNHAEQDQENLRDGHGK